MRLALSFLFCCALSLPVVDGAGVSTGDNGMLVGHAHIALRGHEVGSWPDNGTRPYGDSFLEICDCLVHDVTHGVGLSGGSGAWDLTVP